MRRISILACLASSVVLAVACSSSEDPAPGPQPGADTGVDDASDAAVDTGADADATPDDGTDVPADTGGEVDAGPKTAGWDRDFALPGVQGDVTSHVSTVAVSPNPKRWVYIGGRFQQAGSAKANNVALWNGSKWANLGDGLPGEVWSLAVTEDDEVYAAVAFDASSKVFHWNKTAWVEIGSSESLIRRVDVKKDGSAVWIIGDFEKIGAVDAKYVARYEGSAWSAVGLDLDQAPDSVRVHGAGACVGGYAEVVGLRCWNGTTWQDRTANLKGGSVHAIREDSAGNLVIGGTFTNVDDFSAPGGVARWNATDARWELIGGGTGVEGEGPGVVQDVAVHGDRVYVTGRLHVVGALAVSHVAMFDGKKWWDMDGGISFPLGSFDIFGTPGRALAIDAGGSLYVGGKLSRGGGVTSAYVTHWNGSAWSALDDPKERRLGINGGGAAAATAGPDGSVYVGGGFELVGPNVVAHRIARYKDGKWSPLGLGLNEQVTSLAVKGADVLAAGSFSGSGVTASGAPIIPARGIARWDGATWSGLGGGLDGAARVVAVAPDGKIWVGGEFEHAGTTPSSRIAVWDGSAWTSPGGGLGASGWPYVSSIVFHEGKVYAAGEIELPIPGGSGEKGYGVAVWDGTTWSMVGAPFSKPATALAVYKGKLVASGQFQSIGGTKIRHLATWDGTAWTQLAGGLANGEPMPGPDGGTVDPDAFVTQLGVRGDDLFVGGAFEKAGTVAARHVAHWNGSAWSALDGGVDDVVQGLGVAPDALWIVGSFTSAGGWGSVRVGRWVFPE